MAQALLDRCVLASRTFPPLTWPQPIACAPRPSVVRGNRRPTATGYGNRVGMSPHGGRHRSPPATRRRFSGCLTHSTCGARCGGAKQPRCPTFVARPQLMLAVENAQRDANHCRDPAAHPNLHQQCETRVADRLAAFASGCRVASPPRRCAPRFLYHAWSVGRGLPQRRGHLCLHWTRHDVWSWQPRSPRPQKIPSLRGPVAERGLFLAATRRRNDACTEDEFSDCTPEALPERNWPRSCRASRHPRRLGQCPTER